MYRTENNQFLVFERRKEIDMNGTTKVFSKKSHAFSLNSKQDSTLRLRILTMMSAKKLGNIPEKLRKSLKSII